jgi:hypothetical protein
MRLLKFNVLDVGLCGIYGVIRLELLDWGHNFSANAGNFSIVQ